jgi:hypothetical protein
MAFIFLNSIIIYKPMLPLTFYVVKRVFLSGKIVSRVCFKTELAAKWLDLRFIMRCFVACTGHLVLLG